MIKVKGKIFVFLGPVEGALRVTVKLPISFEMALTLPFTAPTGYGLGRAKWITARLAAGEKPPIDLLQGWITQSYRAVAPRRLARLLDGAAPGARMERSAIQAAARSRDHKSRR